MREFLDRYSIRQIVTGVIIGVALIFLAVAFVAGGWDGVKIFLAFVGIMAAAGALVMSTAWLIDYIQMREWEEEDRRKEK